MTHLGMDDLLQLREPGLEPGGTAAREHLAACPACQAELDRLHQRAARLRALPTLRPARDHWPLIKSRLTRARRQRRARVGALSGLALAASVTLAIVARDLSNPPSVGAETEISQAMARSHELERTLDAFKPDQRVTDGQTERMAGELEDRIAVIDRQLEMAQLMDPALSDAALLRLWRERVGLLNALVDVHVTRASRIGL
jgi:hypothetical protein